MSADDQTTADLRRDVRRCTEAATREQLEAMRGAWRAHAWVTSDPVAAQQPEYVGPGERVAVQREIVMGDLVLVNCDACADSAPGQWQEPKVCACPCPVVMYQSDACQTCGDLLFGHRKPAPGKWQPKTVSGTRPYVPLPGALTASPVVARTDRDIKPANTVAVALGARADGALEPEHALHGPVRELGGP